MQYLTQSEALANLDQVYHSQFEEIYRTYLARDEQLVAAANCSAKRYPGFFLVTVFRVICVAYFAASKGRSVRYFKEGGGFLSSFEPDERFWFLRPLEPLSTRDIERRNVSDVPLAKIHSVGRKEYKPRAPGGVTLHLLELEFEREVGTYRHGSFPIGPTAFDYEDGQTVYDLTLNAIQSRGIAADDDVKGVVSELERLAALRTAGLLSEEEFLAAKRKLLGLT